MKIVDRIYGDINIENKVIIDLINSDAFQRLKNISQDGATHYIQPIRDLNRFEHSIGVWYLSTLFHRPIEEQIACLLHDISHTAFSHVIDFVFQDDKYEFADRKLNEIIYKSSIPKILKNHNINIEKVLDKSNYHLLENSLPDISVDRWDYFMRDGFALGFLPKVLITTFMSEVFEQDNMFYFKDIRIASTFSILFANCSRLIWLDPTSHAAYFLLSKAIKLGIDTEIITESDFFTDDTTLMNKLNNSPNKEIQGLLSRLIPGNEFVYEEKESAEFYGGNKPRTVDPFVETDDKFKRISELVPNLKYFFEEFHSKYKYFGVRQIVC